MFDNVDDLMRMTSSSMLQIQEQMASLFRQDQANNVAPGSGAFANFVGPMEMTPQTKAQIKRLPLASPGSPSAIWYVHTIEEYEEEGTSSTCMVYQIRKEHGSNGLVLPESDGFGQSLAMSGTLDPNNDSSTRPLLLMGTIAKACLNPGATLGGMNHPASALFDVRPYRPQKILFQTRGELEMIAPDLRDLDITQFDVAEQSLQRSLELYQSNQNDLQYQYKENPLTSGPEALGRALIAQAKFETYVNEPEEPYNLGWWTPPRKRGDFPARCFARAPDNVNSYRPTALLGWRTNLERAILREDTTKVKEIVAKRNPEMITEYVECRMLLTKCAQRGLIQACLLLIQDCNASVEGAQSPHSKSWWLDVQNSSGNCDSLTPLHQACRNGQLESARLLLEHGADVNRIDKASIRGSPLHHAVSTGQIDCCRLLCERGADLTYEGQGGDAIDISELVGHGDFYKERVQKKVQEILREFDRRCSYCRADNPAKACPCKKERYCDADCQRKRWKKHKQYHNEVVGS